MFYYFVDIYYCNRKQFLCNMLLNEAGDRMLGVLGCLESTKITKWLADLRYKRYK